MVKNGFEEEEFAKNLKPQEQIWLSSLRLYLKEGTAKERLSQMQAQATTEVIGETVRQQSLKVIMKAV